MAQAEEITPMEVRPASIRVQVSVPVSQIMVKIVATVCKIPVNCVMTETSHPMTVAAPYAK
jgi:hypothetical protein